MRAPMLTVDRLCKRFGALKVSDQVSFSVQQGEALGIIGPNGAGKSTLFNLISGHIRADSGRIELQGGDVTALSPMQRCRAGVGRSFQIPQPFEGLTVFENLLVAATHGGGRGLTEAEACDECGEILAATELMTVANQPAGGLRLLQRKRLELARALATGPRLLLLDEIAGGLTEEESANLVGTIRAIHARGVTIVWIEHVLHALNAVVERLMVLDFGKVVGIGAPEAMMNSEAVKTIYLGIEA